MIEYRDVYKAFDAPVLEGIDLTIETGERFAIVGPSGTGKSVLLKIAIGLIPPDRGDVLIDGVSVVNASPAELRRIRSKVGYVFQNAALFDSLTVFENVAMGIAERTARELGPVEVLRRVRAALNDVNLDADAVLNKIPAELSGGMRKRVGVARAIIGRPDIILYDEPVTGLDPVTSAAVGYLITKLASRPGVTSVLVTHDVEGALELVDRIALLGHGKLLFVGKPDEFRASNVPLVRAFAHRHAAAEAALGLSEAAE